MPGMGTGLPSGEAVAHAVECATADERGERPRDWQDETPLWLYILREAAFAAQVTTLRSRCRIVAEVIVGIIGSDPESYLTNDPSWRPTLRRISRASSRSATSCSRAANTRAVLTTSVS